MVSCSRFFSFVCVFLCCLIAFCGIYDNPVYAVGTTKTLTPQETRDLIGSTISAQYYDGSSMVDFTFEYGGTAQLGTMLVDGSPTLSFAQGDTVIWYAAQVSPNTNPQYITVDVRPRYSFFDTEYIAQMCGLTCGTVPGTSVYSPPSWRWHTSYNGDTIIENQFTANNAYYAICNVSINNTQQHFTFVDAVFDRQSTFSAYSDRALFYGNAAVNGYVYLVLSCPTISDTSTMASGTGAGSTGSSVSGTVDVNVTVDVDMSETNGWLSDIADILSGLVDAIVGIFIPDDDDLLQWLDDMHDMLREHFGSFVDAMLIIDEVFDAVHDGTASGTPQGMSDVSVSTSTIGLPANRTIVGYGVSFTFDASKWQMPLVPDGFSGVLGLFKDFQKIIYLILFINMINNKLHHYLSPQDGT